MPSLLTKTSSAASAASASSLIRIVFVLIHSGLYFLYFTIRFLLEFFICDVFGIDLFPPNNDDSIAYDFIECFIGSLSSIVQFLSYLVTSIYSHYSNYKKRGGINLIRLLVSRGISSVMITYATTSILVIRLPSIPIVSYSFNLVKFISYGWLSIKLIRKYNINLAKVEEKVWLLLSQYIAWTRSMTAADRGFSRSRWRLTHVFKIMILMALIIHSSFGFPSKLLLMIWRNRNALAPKYFHRFHWQSQSGLLGQQRLDEYDKLNNPYLSNDEEEYYTAIIPSCYDGDTCHMEDLQYHSYDPTSTITAYTTTKLPGMFATMNVRILGIDAPELSKRSSKCDFEQCLAMIAKVYLQHILRVGDDIDVAGDDTRRRHSPERVKLVNCKFDKYGGRITCDIQTPVVYSVSATMLESGLTVPYTGKTKKTYSWCNEYDKDDDDTFQAIVRQALDKIFNDNHQNATHQEEKERDLFSYHMILSSCSNFWDDIMDYNTNDDEEDFDDIYYSEDLKVTDEDAAHDHVHLDQDDDQYKEKDEPINADAYDHHYATSSLSPSSSESEWHGHNDIDDFDDNGRDVHIHDTTYTLLAEQACNDGDAGGDNEASSEGYDDFDVTNYSAADDDDGFDDDDDDEDYHNDEDDEYG